LPIAFFMAISQADTALRNTSFSGSAQAARARSEISLEPATIQRKAQVSSRSLTAPKRLRTIR